MQKKVIIGVVSLLVLIAGLVVGLFLVRQQQEIRKRAAPASVVSILPPATTVNVGERFDLTINIDSNENLVIGADLVFTYDPTILQMDELTPGTFLPTKLAGPQIDNSQGTASITLGAQPTNEPSGKGLLATLKFTSLKAGTTAVNFGAGTRGRGIDEGLGDIFIAKNPSTVTVLGAQISPTPSPQASPSPSPTPTPGITATPSPSPSPSPSPGTGGIVTSPTPSPSPTSTTTGTSTKGSGSGGTTTSAGTKTTTTSGAGGTTTTTTLPEAGVSLPMIVGGAAGVLILLIGILLAF